MSHGFLKKGSVLLICQIQEVEQDISADVGYLEGNP
jgi:hypothetical protein